MNKKQDLINKFRDANYSDNELRFFSWVLNCVYGWDISRISRFKLKTLNYWLRKAKKRMTVGDLIAINQFFSLSKKKTLWQRIMNR